MAKMHLRAPGDFRDGFSRTACGQIRLPVTDKLHGVNCKTCLLSQAANKMTSYPTKKEI